MRIPRLKGSTILSINKDIDNLYYLYTNTYFTNGYTLFNNTILSFEDFCTSTSIPFSILEKNMSRMTTDNLGVLDLSQIKSALALALERVFSGALSDSHMARNQALCLLRSQQGQYRPFVSATVNSAIELSMKGTGQLIKVVELLSQRIPESSLVKENTQTDQAYLTIEAAVEIVNTEIKQRSLTANQPNIQLQEMYDANRISEMPDVNGRRVSPAPIQFDRPDMITDLNEIEDFLNEPIEPEVL